MPAEVLLNESVERIGRMAFNATCPPLPTDRSSWGFVVNGVVTTMFVCLGIIGNLYHVRTLRRNSAHSKSRLTSYLRVLCIWDVTLLTCTFGFYGFVVVWTGRKPWYGDITYMYMIFYPLCQVSWTGSMFVVTAITTERYLALVRPFRKFLSEVRSVTRICWCIFVGVLVINLPTFFELTQISCFDQKTQSHKRMIWLSALRQNKTYMLIFRIIIYPAIVSFLPFIAIVFLTIKTIFVRRHAVSKCPSNQSLAQSFPAKESGTTAVLTTLIVKFLLCYSMPTVLYIFEYVDSQAPNTRLIDISNFLIVFHSATNWLIFWQWNANKSSRKHKQRHLFKEEEVKRLQYLWSSTRPTEVGRDLLYTLIRANRPLAFHFANNNNCYNNNNNNNNNNNLPYPATLKQTGDYGNGDALLCECRLSAEPQSPACEHNIQLLAKVDSHGAAVGLFFDRIIKRLGDKHEQQTIVNEIRELGSAHYRSRVMLRNADWFLAKQFLVAKLVMDDSEINIEDSRIVSKFVSFLIHEIKCGRTCAIAIEDSVDLFPAGIGTTQM